MNQFIESLHRLYKDKKIDKKKIGELLLSKKINQSEYEYIVSDENVVVEVV